MNEHHARQVLRLGIPAAAVGLIAVPYLAVRSDLPDRLATHFDGSGTPDGSMTPTGFFLFTLALSGLGIAGCMWLGLSRRELPSAVAPAVGFLSGFFAGLGSGIALITFLSQRGNADWTQADGLWLLIVVPIVISLIVGAITARLATYLPVSRPSIEPGAQPVMDLADGQHAVWAETLRSPLLLAVGVASFLIGVIVAAGTIWWLVLPGALTCLVTLALATFRVRADRRGFHVKYGMLPWPTTNLAVEDIDTASVIDVRPMEWGGWGYRGSLKLMKQAAVVHRAGPGIRLDLTDGRVFVVTVDDPETPVALLNSEIARLA